MEVDNTSDDDAKAQEMQNTNDSKTTNEGKAHVFLPTSVFYNPVQEFNRDLTIAVISQYAKDHFRKSRQKQHDKSKCEEQKDSKVCDKEDDNVCVSIKEDLELEAGKKYEDGIRILEGLAASGLRSVRFALEVPGVREIVTNDFSKAAVEFIRKNATHNQVEHLITPSHNDAAMLMYQNRKFTDRFDIIDLDPYGSPVAFLDAGVQSVKDGGLLCITCTDMAILCGNNPETCYAKYSAMPLRSKFCHEMALRILIRTIESHANRYSRYIVPLLSVSVDFYIRVFVKVYTGQNKVKQSVGKQSMVYQCAGCGSFELQPLSTQTQTKGGNFTVHPAKGPTVADRCSHCGHFHRLGGPIWSAPIHDVSFMTKVIQTVQRNPEKFGTAERIIGMLNVMSEELQDVPLYYVMDGLCSTLHCTSPSLLQFRYVSLFFKMLFNHLIVVLCLINDFCFILFN